jgi:GNAT superfamily N-acetyltransferase
MKAGEETEVFNLIARVFDEFVAPGYSQEGVQAFLDYVQPEALLTRSADNHLTLLALADTQILGVIDMRSCHHISLLFVDTAYQGQGISRALLDTALSLCRELGHDLAEITVNSSPYAIPIYERLGFRATAGEQVKNGIRFTPMVLER